MLELRKADKLKTACIVSSASKKHGVMKTKGSENGWSSARVPNTS